MTQENQAKPLPAWLQVAADGVTITLKHKVELAGVQVERLTMRAPCVRDVRAATAAGGGDDEKMEMSLFSSLLAATEAELLALKYVDYLRVQAGYFRLVSEGDV
jgi:hypothetical protein